MNLNEIKRSNLTELGEQFFFLHNIMDVPNGENYLWQKHSTDYLHNGVLLEFKKKSDETALRQAIGYCRNIVNAGGDCPAWIGTVWQDTAIVTIYEIDSSRAFSDYVDECLEGGSMSASKIKESIPSNVLDDVNKKTFKLYDKQGELVDLVNFLNRDHSKKPHKIHLNEYNVVKRAERFYKEHPECEKDRTKDQFLGTSDVSKNSKLSVGEIYNPVVFKNSMHPYKGDIKEFKFLLDCLNDKINQKDIGAFYTHPQYGKLAVEELLIPAIKAAKAKKPDYMLLDRCAGSGNLWRSVLAVANGEETSEKMTQAFAKEILEHAYLNTLDYFEYIELVASFGETGATIIPPPDLSDIENEISLGLDKKFSRLLSPYYTKNGNALAEWFNDSSKNPAVWNKVYDKDCAVILFENPPYTSSSTSATGGSEARKERDKKLSEKEKAIVAAQKWQSSHVAKQFNSARKERPTDASQCFIWSAFDQFIRRDGDAYILFAPLKYWKADGLCEKKLVKGFLLNKLAFHATEASGVGCVWWDAANGDNSKISLQAWDIQFVDKKRKVISENDTLVLMPEDKENKKYKWAVKKDGMVEVRKVKHNHTENLADVPHKNTTGIVCGFDGQIKSIRQTPKRPAFDSNQEFPWGYLMCHRNGIQTNAHMNLGMVSLPCDDNSAYAITSASVERICCLFAMKQWMGSVNESSFITDEVIYPSADKGLDFLQDRQFVHACLLWTALTAHNHCLSLELPDGSVVRNEMCINGKRTKLGDKLDQVKSEIQDDDYLDEVAELLEAWGRIQRYAKKAVGLDGEIKYRSDFTYGLHQINDPLEDKDGSPMNLNVVDFHNKNHAGDNHERYEDFDVDANGNYLSKDKTIRWIVNEKLNSECASFLKSLREFYNKFCVPGLFKYELLK